MVPAGPPPPPGMPSAPAMPAKKKQEPKAKLKQVHWVKVNERKIKDTIWEKMKDELVNIDKDEIERLFAMKEGKSGVRGSVAGGGRAHSQCMRAPNLS